MLKKQSKKLAIMLVLSMIASLFVGVGTASAANGVAVSVSRVMSAEGDAGKIQIGDLQIKEDGDYTNAFSASGDSFIITLPTNLKWWKNTDGTYKGENEINATEGTIDVKISGNYTMTVKVTGDADGTAKDVYTIPMYVNFDGVEEGYAYATIEALDSPVPGGDYAVANVLGGGTSLTCASTFTAGQDTEAKFTIRITETTVGTFDGAETEEIKLTLPKDVEFKKGAATVTALGGFTDVAPTGAARYEDNKLFFTLASLGIAPTVQGVDTARGIIEIEATVNIASDAKLGEVVIDVESDDDTVDAESVKVGTVADYGVALGVDDPTTVLAGTVCQELGTITIYENVPEALTANRSITLTLPDGVKFAGAYREADIERTKGSGTHELSDADESSITIKLDGMSSTSRTKYEIPMETLNIAADFLGDIVVEVSGRAGVEGEVVIGTVVAPVEVAIDTVADVKIGYQNQAVGDIVITETEAGALLEDGYVVVGFYDDGVTFVDKAVDVEVTAGNLEITNVKVYDDAVTFKIDSESTTSTPAEITISNVALNIDRTVAEGPVKVVLGGDALIQSYEVMTAVAAAEYDTNYTVDLEGDVEDYLFDEDEMGRYTVANCVTPGVQETVTGAEVATSSFVIGSTAAVINGEASALPVAPVIVNGRTLLPVRYLSYACGVQESNVVWNPGEQTVTILGSAGVVIQLTIGSNTMLVNGIPVVMDVAPQIINGYTYLPGRYVANALGYNVGWDAATQTVTITPLA